MPDIYNQASSILKEVVAQATGTKDIATLNTSDFTTVATTAMQLGYDPLMTAISRVLSRTIFSVRPYEAKFKGLMADSIRYGDHVRKINYIDKGVVDSAPYTLTDGQSVDQYIVRKPQVVQTNFYGNNTWQDYITRYEDQLDVSLTGPEQFMSFITGLMTELTNKHEQETEAMSRAALVNLIAGILAYTDYPNGRVVKLLTEYNTQTGLALTSTTVYKPENFPAFIKWVYGRVASLSSMLTERSAMYHTNFTINGTDSNIMRHTPHRDQKVYLNAGTNYAVNAQVLADTFHDNYLKYADVEFVNYWQDIKSPNGIKATPSYMKKDGTIFMPVLSGDNATAATTASNVFGVIFDREAVGVTMTMNKLAATPFNARGHYTNLWWTSVYRWWNDFTENAIVLLME